MQKIISKSEKETIKFAKQFTKQLRGSEAILLFGDLGSGKTTFVKGLARGFGARERVTSPTFVLMRQYRIRNQEAGIKNFVHIDAYRLKTARELLQDVGLAEWLGRKDAVVVIEWGEKIKPFLKGKKFWQIEFSHGKKENERKIRVLKKGSVKAEPK